MGIYRSYRKLRKVVLQPFRRMGKKLKLERWFGWLRPKVWVPRLSRAWLLRLATLGPVGNRLCAPGTVASFLGLGYYTAVYRGLPGWGFLAFAAFSVLYFAIPICDAAEKAVGMEDPSCIVLDEFVAMPLCFFGFPAASGVLLGAGFAIFRYFDIWKPLGIYLLEDWRGGRGIVLDDLAAALATNIVLHVLFTGSGLCRLFLQA